MKIEDLIGKTIKTATKRKGIPDKYNNGILSDDECFLDLEFTDGTKCTIVADYGGYTGKSIDEYPRFILIRDFGYNE